MTETRLTALILLAGHCSNSNTTTAGSNSSRRRRRRRRSNSSRSSSGGGGGGGSGSRHEKLVLRAQTLADKLDDADRGPAVAFLPPHTVRPQLVDQPLALDPHQGPREGQLPRGGVAPTLWPLGVRRAQPFHHRKVTGADSVGLERRASHQVLPLAQVVAAESKSEGNAAAAFAYSAVAFAAAAAVTVGGQDSHQALARANGQIRRRAAQVLSVDQRGRCTLDGGQPSQVEIGHVHGHSFHRAARVGRAAAASASSG